MRRVGKGFSSRVTPLFQTPTFIQPSTQPQKTQQPRKPKRKDTQVPQPSDPIENVADEAVYKELGDSLGMIDAIDADEEITLVSVHDVNISAGEEVFIVEQEFAEEVVGVINTAKLIIDAAQDSATITVSTATIKTVDDITLAQALEENENYKTQEERGWFYKSGQEKKSLSIEEKNVDRAFKRVNTIERLRSGVGEGQRKESRNRADEEKVAIDAIPLAVKSPSIVGWKIHKEGRKSYYQIIRAYGKSQMYMIFSQMLKSFDKEDLEDLYKLVKDKYKSTRPVEDLDLIL
ncbi:hypothetical protein Tco_0699135 [Tanacetum coccineum]